MLAENSGVKPKEVIAKLYAAHSEGKTNMGFDIEGDSGEIKVHHQQKNLAKGRNLSLPPPLPGLSGVRGL